MVCPLHAAAVRGGVAGALVVGTQCPTWQVVTNSQIRIPDAEHADDVQTL